MCNVQRQRTEKNLEGSRSDQISRSCRSTGKLVKNLGEALNKRRFEQGPGTEKGSQTGREGRLEMGVEQMSLQLLRHFSSHYLELKLVSRFQLWGNREKMTFLLPLFFKSRFVTYESITILLRCTSKNTKSKPPTKLTYARLGQIPYLGEMETFFTEL